MTKEKQSKAAEIPEEVQIETPVIDPLDRAEDLFRNNIKLLGYITAAVLAVGAAVALFMYYRGTQNEEAQKELFPAVYEFEADSLNKALKGNGNHLGLIQIADDFSGTDAATQAEFYIGAAYLKQGKFQEAIDHLEKFNAGDALVQARAYSLIGDAYSELNKTDEAISWYKKASEHQPNKQFTPVYLFKLGIAQEKAKDFAGAKETYSKIAENYPESSEAAEAKKLKAKNEEAAQ